MSQPAPGTGATRARIPAAPPEEPARLEPGVATVGNGASR